MTAAAILSDSSLEHAEPCPSCKAKDGLIILLDRQPDGTGLGWMQCDCGFNPFLEADKVESLVGEIDTWTVICAVKVWNAKVAGQG